MKKRNTHFAFKQFTVFHDKCAMKVGTDAVLLGAWAQVQGSRRILDVGTGSGIIALMMAQRTSDQTLVEGVDISDPEVKQALENIHRSPWSNRMRIFQGDVRDFRPKDAYDMVISNPPYFINSLKPPDERRTTTRHADNLSHVALIDAFKRLLGEQGKFNIILPYAEGNNFFSTAVQNNFFCTRKYRFRTRQDKPIERWLLEFSRKEQPMTEGEIILYENGLNWSPGYVELTREFYVKL